MSWREFTHWMAFLELEPPEAAENYRLAVLLSQMTNMAGKSLPKGRKVKPEDFLPKRPEKEQDSQDQKKFFMSLRGAQDG
jgi:hypothetical protein